MFAYGDPGGLHQSGPSFSTPSPDCVEPCIEGDVNPSGRSGESKVRGEWARQGSRAKSLVDVFGTRFVSIESWTMGCLGDVGQMPP